MSKVKVAIQILRTQGISQLIKYSADYFLRIASKVKWVDNVIFEISKRKLHVFMRTEKCLDDILDTTYNYSGYGHYSTIAPAQIQEEIKSLAEMAKQNRPRTIVEIGTAAGGTLYILCRYVKSAQKIVSIDLPGGRFGGGYPAQKEKFFREFASDKKIYLLRGDSHTDEIMSALSKILNGENVDFLFIDGDHTYAGVKDDFQRYKGFVAKSGIVAFHDIVYHPQVPECEVYKFWKEVKTNYDTEEIIASKNQIWGGIGVIYLANRKRKND